MYFHIVVFSKSMSCKCFHVNRSNLHLIGSNIVRKKTLHVEGNKIPKANLKCTCRFTRLFNFNTVRALSRTNSEVTKSHTKGDDDIELSMG